MYVDVSASVVASGASLYGGPLVRASTDLNNWYHARIDLTTSNTVLLTLRKRVAGQEAQLGSTYTSGFTQAAGKVYRVRLQAFGSTIQAKIFDPAQPEPRVASVRHGHVPDDGGQRRMPLLLQHRQQQQQPRHPLRHVPRGQPASVHRRTQREQRRQDAGHRQHRGSRVPSIVAL
ncbi:hypothetical protein E4K10_18270 [Streptomyces sp. T1317-0309]|nr:hypothetical protein E4K10_18270 [Streptomyces sp. T1317-0309]